MSEAILGVILSAVIQVAGLVQSQRLLTYRLGQLETRVNKHNSLIERMYRVEDRAKSNTHRLDALESIWKEEIPTR